MRLRTLVWRNLRAEKPVLHQFPGDPAGNYGDRFDQEHHLLLRESRCPGDGFAGSERADSAETATLQDYYAADMQGDTIPREYITNWPCPT